MTTIVGDWLNKKLVADSQFSDDDAGIKYFEEKVFQIDGGYLQEIMLMPKKLQIFLIKKQK